MKARKGLAQVILTLELMRRRQPQRIASSTGQPQMIRYSNPGLMFLTMRLNMEGMRQEQKKYNTATQKYGMNADRKEFKQKGRLLMTAMMTVRRAVKAKNMQSWQMVGRKMVSKMSAASMRERATAQVTYLTILLLSVSNISCSMNMARGSFHIIQLKIRVSATVLASVSSVQLQKVAEDSILLFTLKSQQLI